MSPLILSRVFAGFALCAQQRSLSACAPRAGEPVPEHRSWSEAGCAQPAGEGGREGGEGGREGGSCLEAWAHVGFNQGSLRRRGVL